MNAIDLLIIYLACGAPFGVYYFFQNRTSVKSSLLWFKTVLNFLFWLPLAFRLLRRNKNLTKLSAFGSHKAKVKKSEREANIRSTVKRIEKIFLASDLKISVYEFREIIERYIGLTITCQTDAREVSDADKNFLRVVETPSVELGAVCLSRRNRKRLSVHQTEARKDFLRLINQLIEFHSDERKLEQSAIELVIILSDFEARSEIEQMFASSLQTAERSNVTEQEKDLWKPPTPKLPAAKPIAYRLPTMKATLNLRSED